MTDLTEQWKKGELPSADENHTWLAYYLKQASGRIHADSCWRGNWGHADRNSIIKVLEPVPSYEEYNRLKEVERKKGKLVNVNYKIKQENERLKELLKECRDVIKDVDTYCTKNADEGYILTYKIDNAIGEK